MDILSDILKHLMLICNTFKKLKKKNEQFRFEIL